MFDILKALWPFVSEMFFGGKSLKDVVRTNKLMSVILVVLALSLTLNYFSIGKLWDLAVDKQKNKAPQSAQQPDKPLLPPGYPASAASEPANPGTGQDSEQQRQERLRKRLQDLYKD